MRVKSFLIAFAAMFYANFSFGDDGFEWKTVNVDGINYKCPFSVILSLGGRAYVVKGDYSGNIVIPNTIEASVNGTSTLVVDRIIMDAFQGCSDLKSITIPSSVKAFKYPNYPDLDFYGDGDISDNPFKGCSNLESIVYEGHKECNAIIDAFGCLASGCKNTEIPDDVKTIGRNAFNGCVGLTSIVIPQNVREILYGAFFGCTNLKDLYIEGRAPYFALYSGGFVGDDEDNIQAFDESIRNTILHVKDIYFDSYYGKKPWCNFKEIVCDEKVTDFDLTYCVDGAEYKTVQYKFGDEITPLEEPTREGYTFSGWSEIPETMPAHDVKVTGSFTVNKYKLTYMVDGSEYKSYEIEYGAKITPVAEPTKENYSFSGWSTIPETMPAEDFVITGSFARVGFAVDGVTFRLAEDGSAYVSKCSQGGSITIMPSYAIDDNTYTVIAIEDNAFNGNTGVTSVTIPPTVTSIGNKGFYGCSKLATINIGNGTISIGERAFANIDKLTDVTVYAENLPETDRTAFENSYIEDYVTLHVPESAIEKYKTTAPWKNFMNIVPISIPGTNKCGLPTIAFKSGRLLFDCETEDVEYNYEVTANLSLKGKGNGIPVDPSITVSVYASKEGYEDSDVVTKDISLSSSGINLDANGDGVINAADVVTIVNAIMSEHQ